MSYDACVTSAPAHPPPDGIELHRDVPLARHTYLRVGGPARYLAIPETPSDLERLLEWATTDPACHRR